MERKEKIAFIFPAAKDANGNEGPILNFQCEKLPVDTRVTVAAAFVGLKQSKEYLISLDIVDKDGATILKESPDKLPVEVPVTANDDDADPADVPGFLRADLLVRMVSVGVHTIKISITSASELSKILHETEARFRVILKGENK
ncbi:hypothetical protein HGO23_06510 [Xenorhabdus budapestensis]|uniref:Uncharacterized protein n=1 Tax=Xenorhabdus budapestensis TaxID=290110 RepID=A0ABX7VMY1_XENBU|nr:hypothetical protein [Xenorhabdus budapestensis]QTL40987.1 hypothetical protein HGO23_06510 [Xenorhabdus budapestensis]